MYLSVKQAAENLGLSTKTIYRMIDDGRLKASYLSPRCIRINPDEISAMMTAKAN